MRNHFNNYNSINWKWSIIWVFIHFASLFLLSLGIQQLSLNNGLIILFFTGVGVTIISRIVKTFTRKKTFVVDKWFFFWSLINTTTIWLVLLLTSLLIISQLLALLLVAIGLVIVTHFIKRLRITNTAMILTSILLILILLFFNYDTSNLSNQVTGTPILFQSNNLFTNVKESTPKLFSQIFSGISLPNEKLLSTKCKKSYDICKEIFYQKYGFSHSIIKMEKFEDKSKAKEFFNTWKSYSVLFQTDTEFDNLHLPVVLFAIKSTGPKEEQFVGVFICDRSGDFTESSKRNICY